MIKVEHIVAPSNDQMNFIIEGMRNPLNSWDKSDSGFKQQPDASGIPSFSWEVGEADMDLMNRLRNAGTDHRKFMRQMPLMMRITAPLYWWKEADQYRIGVTTNSCSTMHKIHAKEFTMDDFSCENLTKQFDDVSEQVGVMISEDYVEYDLSSTEVLGITVQALNKYRERFLETKDKQLWWQMIQLLPSSYNQTRNISMNYEVALNMYQARLNHKLDEWRSFCLILSTLPYGFLITGKDDSYVKGE